MSKPTLALAAVLGAFSLCQLMTSNAMAGPCVPDNKGLCVPAIVSSGLGNGGLAVTFSLDPDAGIPDEMRLFRQLGLTTGPTPGSNPLQSCTACASQTFVDGTAKPGTLYRYWVCAVWSDVGMLCSSPVDQGLPGQTPPPPPPPPTPTYPHNLKISETVGWATPTRLERRWQWLWTAGNQVDYVRVEREQFVASPAGWNQLGSLLPGAAASFDEVIANPHELRTGKYRVCGANFHPGGGPLDEKGCSNAVDFVSKPVPPPRAPIKTGAAAVSQQDIEIGFEPGDENNTASFDLERSNKRGDRWVAVKSRIPNSNTRVNLVDNGQSVPAGFDPGLTYRACAVNESGRTCSAPFKAGAITTLVQGFKIAGLAGKCLTVGTTDLTGAARNGDRATLSACLAMSGQQIASQVWTIPQTTAHPIVESGGKCLDVSGANSQSGTPVILWDCNGGANQSWRFASDGTIRGLAGKCLDVAGANSSDDTPLILWDCHGGSNQKWQRTCVSGVCR